MAHYNLYESIGLDRARPSEELAEEIRRRLNAGDTGNPGGADELQVALDIFSEPSRRSHYDTILDDPDQPELRISGLRKIAAEGGSGAAEAAGAASGNGSGAGSTVSPQESQQDQQQAASGQFPQFGQYGQPQPGQYQQFAQPQAGQQFGQAQQGQYGQFGQPQPGQYQQYGQPQQGQYGQFGQPQQGQYQQYGQPGQQPRQSAVAGAKNAFSGVGQKLSGATGNLKGEYARSSGKAIAVTAVATALVCLLVFGLVWWLVGGSGTGGGKPVKMAEEFISKGTDRDRVDWLNEHFDPDLAEDLFGGEGGWEESPSSEDFNDVYTDAVGAGSVQVVGDGDYGSSMNLMGSVDDKTFMEAVESETGITALHVVGVGNGETDVPKAWLMFAQVDGDWRVLFPAEAQEADDLEDVIAF
ncbi:hypothetical protein [Corynebacterium frankenforstense]|uniref:hypothetical protein n=1 Tax=Corynebacterium frankenforstense TaxID=1230998 RepID=UPI000951A98E|nr:hypothetical protein [Corynebacterium frankenforstense]